MAYEEMLYNILEHHKKNQDISKKVYRYTGLIHAIEFFSQKFNLVHLEKYIYEFTNELLLPDKIAIFIKEGKNYELKQKKGYDNNDYTIRYNKQFDNIICYHSGLFNKENLINSFLREVIDTFPCEFAIPLIMNKELFGFIFVNKLDGFSRDDKIIAKALMNLYSTSLTNHKYYKDLEEVSKQLNEKLFNLYAINHSSKVLLKQLDLSTLYKLSISAFAELTQSSFTTFFLYDDISESYKLMSYKDVYNSNLIMFINLYPAASFNNKDVRMLTDMNNLIHREEFYNLFVNGQEMLKDIKTDYIISIKQNENLIGFVTLGTKVNDSKYEKNIFELIESLASTTYIAISNAKYFEEINRQKEIINNKFNRLVKLNLLMKNINSAKNIDQLIDLTISTLSVFFGVTSGFIGLYDDKKDIINIKDSININNELKEMPFVEGLLPIKNGEKIVLNSMIDIEETFPNDIVEAFEQNYCGGVFVPIFVEDNELKLLGIIGILAIKDKIIGDEENIVTMESIASHIAPVMYQFHSLEQVKEQYKFDYQTIFLKELEQGLVEAEEFYLELKVLHICMKNQFTFSRINTEILNEHFKKVYSVDNTNVFIISCEKNPVEKIKMIMGNTIYCKQYEYGKDFNCVNEFVELFT
ncbi:MAG: GAF domain-containing protein [Vallitalea sp.]|jgi:transcriptional regulator with GAF, ATPase, and Fis domain|nr:GAF domain-containing protein [Vallitalea sp.]